MTANRVPEQVAAHRHEQRHVETIDKRKGGVTETPLTSIELLTASKLDAMGKDHQNDSQSFDNIEINTSISHLVILADSLSTNYSIYSIYIPLL